MMHTLDQVYGQHSDPKISMARTLDYKFQLYISEMTMFYKLELLEALWSQLRLLTVVNSLKMMGETASG